MGDAKFAELAVTKGLVTAQQVREAVAEQKKYPKGQVPPLARVMAGLGMLASEQAKEIMQGLGQPVLSIEGYEMVEKVSSSKEVGAYRAIQLSMQRTVLLKVLEGERAGDEVAVRRFLTEARAAGQLNHPNVTRVHEVGQSGGKYFYSMEYVEGRTLEEMLKEGVAPPRACEICAQIADALDYAARVDVVHGEVTPSVVVVTNEGQAKLSGLGLTRPSSTRFLLGENCQYVAPEVVQGAPPDARSDTYSLGCIVFRATAGRAAFPGRTPKEVLGSHVSSPVPDARASNPQLPRELASIIARAMAKSPSARYASASEMASALRSVKFEARHPRRRRRRRSRRR